MDKTPRELKTYFDNRYPGGHYPGQCLYLYDVRGRGIRHTFKSHGVNVVNQITITEDPNYNPTPSCWGYLYMERFLVGELTPKDPHHDSTMRGSQQELDGVF